ISGLKRKAVFAALGLHPGETVSTERLTHIVWGTTPPATALNALQTHVSYLRRVLGDAMPIVARSPGYALDISPDAVDVSVAEQLIRHGETDVHPDQTAEQLRTALGMWRGRALVDVAELPWFDNQSERLENVRLGAVQALIELRLKRGEHLDV